MTNQEKFFRDARFMLWTAFIGYGVGGLIGVAIAFAERFAQ